MSNKSIPANAHNGVVAGENAKTMANKIYYLPQPDGTQIMIKFGYADHNGDYYTLFADASKANSGEGATYVAFVASVKPDNNDTNPCWKIDAMSVFMDRALTAEEKQQFENGYMEHAHKMSAAADAATLFLRTVQSYGFTLGDNEQICSYHNRIMNAIYEQFEQFMNE